MFTFWTFWIFINNLSWWTRTILNTYTENILFQAYSEKSRSFEIRSCTVTEATLIRFVSIIAQVPPDPRFSLSDVSVLLIFGMVCHLTIRIFHRYLGSSVALTRWIFLTNTICLIADIIPDLNLCLLYSFVLFSNFRAAVSAFALLSCSIVHVAALFLYWFIEQIMTLALDLCQTLLKSPSSQLLIL